MIQIRGKLIACPPPDRFADAFGAILGAPYRQVKARSNCSETYFSLARRLCVPCSFPLQKIARLP